MSPRPRAALLALVATLAVAAAFVAAQPLAAPWWFYADSDAVYVSSALNIVGGAGTKFFDHPGLPLQQLAALTFEVRRWFTGADSTRSYVDGLLLHLDATRPYYRAYGIALFLAGVAAAFALGRRLLGHWIWGMAAGLIVLGAPGLVPMSIQFRADTALPLLLLGGTLLTAEAARRRDAPLFLAAAAVAGVSLTVKLSSLPLLVGLAVAAIWRRPVDAELRRVADALRRHRIAAASAAALWVAAAVVLNRLRMPFHPKASGVIVAGLLVAVVLAWALAARRVDRGLLRPFFAAVAAAVVAGLLLPVTLTFADGLAMLPWIGRGVTGGGVNETAPLFATGHLGVLSRFPLVYGLPLIVLPVGALFVGIRRRDPVLTPLALAASVALLMTASRIVGREWYFIPPYVLAIAPTLLWLRTVPRRGAAAAAALVGLALVPQALHARDPAREAARETRAARAAEALAAGRLAPGQIALTPAEYPVPDTRYFELVQTYDVRPAARRFRFLPATRAAAAFAAAHGLRPVLAVGDIADRPSISFGDSTLATHRLPMQATPFAVARIGP